MSSRPLFLLVVANRTVTAPTLAREIQERLAEGSRVHVVAPALNSRLRHWVSDSDHATGAARARLAEAMATLSAEGLDVTGEVGDADPALAIQDALAAFPADEVLISTLSPETSNWLGHDLIERVTDSLAIPVHHVITAAESDERAEQDAVLAGDA